jgi:hypothetical protein
LISFLTGLLKLDGVDGPGDPGSAFALTFVAIVGFASVFGFAGDCLLKNDLIPSDRSDTGCMKVGDSFPTFPTSGGTG